MAKMGRPTDYSEELARKAWDYLDDFETIYGHGIPSHLGLCEALSINKIYCSYILGFIRWKVFKVFFYDTLMQ
jgi:hypothetical protein